jgi:hypothetical protein
MAGNLTTDAHLAALAIASVLHRDADSDQNQLTWETNRKIEITTMSIALFGPVVRRAMVPRHNEESVLHVTDRWIEPARFLPIFARQYGPAKVPATLRDQSDPPS